jgi:hypothetical protein
MVQLLFSISRRSLMLYYYSGYQYSLASDLNVVSLQFLTTISLISIGRTETRNQFLVSIVQSSRRHRYTSRAGTQSPALVKTSRSRFLGGDGRRMRGNDVFQILYLSTSERFHVVLGYVTSD